MSEEKAPAAAHFAAEDQAELEYRPVSALAAIGFVAGLASLLSFFHPALMVLPLAGLAVNIAALRRIAASPLPLLGRKGAVAGLCLCLLCLCGAATRYASRQIIVGRQSRQFATEWFQHLAEGQPQKAHQLTVAPLDRVPLDDKTWRAYRNNATLATDLSRYVMNQPMRALLSLKSDAQIRHFQTEAHETKRGADTIDEVFAVTFDNRGERATFFVLVKLLRATDAETGVTGWRINETRPNYRPKALAQPGS